MRWTPGGLGPDVVDRRGMSGGGGFGFGRGPTVGCGGAIILLVLSLLTGRNFFALFDGSGGGGQPIPETASAAPTNETPEEKEAAEFAGFVVKDAQDVWTQIFQANQLEYQRAKLILYRDMTQTACGVGQAASGPFYCPGDGNVYIDLAFNHELSRRFGAPGDVAQAYVIAHEVGHHVQNLLGVHEREGRSRPNDASVAIELQADCFAGIWAHSTAQRNLLEEGEIEEAINAAAAVGDDNIQKMSGRAVSPESFTHGSSEQRMEWFTRGFRSGRVADCDTF